MAPAAPVSPPHRHCACLIESCAQVTPPPAEEEDDEDERFEIVAVVGQTDAGYETGFKGYAEPEVVNEDCFRDGGEKVFDGSAQVLRAKDWHEEAKKVAAPGSDCVLALTVCCRVLLANPSSMTRWQGSRGPPWGQRCGGRWQEGEGRARFRACSRSMFRWAAAVWHS